MQQVRFRIIEIIKEQGSATVSELAEQIGLAQVSVRHHLDILVGEDLVCLAGVRRRPGAGRPSQVFTLTDSATKLFPQRHAILADGILDELKTVLPQAKIREVLARLAEKTSRSAPPSWDGEPLEQRLDEVAGFLTEQGYSARWEACDGFFELHVCNCPYAGVAENHPELCGMDQTMILRLLPHAARVESRVLNGASHCRYVVKQEAESEQDE